MRASRGLRTRSIGAHDGLGRAAAAIVAAFGLFVPLVGSTDSAALVGGADSTSTIDVANSAPLVDVADSAPLVDGADPAPMLGRTGTAQEPQHGEAYLQRGVELLAVGRTADAIEQLERAVALLPGDARALYQLGLALFSAGRAEDAVAPLKAALEAGADPGPVNFLLGQVLLETGDLEAARASLDTAAASRPRYPPIEFYRAELCYRLGRVSVARERFTALATAAPEWSAPIVRSGNLALEQGDTAAAVEWFRALVELSPQDPAPWMRLGAALVEDEQPYEALAAYRRAAEVETDNLVALVAVAIQLINLDESEAAMEALDAVLAKDPADGTIRYHRARLVARAGDREAALAEVDRSLDDLRRSLLENADNPQGRQTLAEALLLRADLLVEAGRSEEAAEIVRDLLADKPDDPDALFLLGNILLRSGDRSGAELLTRFKALSDAREHRQLGDQFRLRQGDPERAAAEYELALRTHPGDAASLLGLGAALRQSGDSERALETLYRAREAGAGGAEWEREWVLSLSAAGRPAEARQAWRDARARGLTLGPEVWALMYAAVEGC